MKQATFETDDLYLSSALWTILKEQPDFRVVNGRTIFVFPVSNTLYEAITEYNNGRKLNAIEWAQTIKRLRAEMLMARNERGTHGTNRKASFK